MDDADIYMVIEASVLLAFVGYMWWGSQSPNEVKLSYIKKKDPETP